MRNQAINGNRKIKRHGSSFKVDSKENLELRETNFVPHSKTDGDIRPALGLAQKRLERVSQVLNMTLSNQHVLYIKTRNYHWNLVGKRFHTLHLFLEEQYNALALAIDETAERVRILGGIPKASMKEFLEAASLREDDGHLIEGDEAISNLLRDHQECVVSLRKYVNEMADNVGDAGTADFMTDLMKAHEKTAWMLRSHLAV